MKNKTSQVSKTLKVFLGLSIIAAATGSYGDDTEVFYSVNVSKPNLLFVLDVSGSMGGKLSGSGDTLTVTKSISHSYADSNQRFSNENTSYTQPTIELSDDYLSRFRFKDLGIPEDSFISNAYIQFQAGVQANPGLATAEAKYYIYTERTDDANLTTNGIDRNKYGTVEWEPGAWNEGEMGAEQRTPDIKDIIQQVVDRRGWNSGNNGLAIYITGEDGKPGKRWVSSFDDPNYAPPTLFVEYSGADKRKIEVMKESLRAVLEDAPDNVKVGLMNYGQESESSSNPEIRRHHNVSGVAFPVTDINAKARDIIATTSDVYGLPSYPDENITVREYIADVADDWSQSSYTPIVDSLYEAALYYRGEKIHYGQTLPTKNGAHPSTYDGAVVNFDMESSGRDRANAPKYISPIESSCQENYIVLMTDGAPTYNIANDGLGINDTLGPLARIRNTANGPQGALASALPTCASPAGVGNAGKCGAELTHYLANNDNLPDPSGSFPNGQEGDQLIKTFTIGFGTGAGSNTETYLKSLATYDDLDTTEGPEEDGYFLASNPAALAEAFRDILDEVAEPKGTLASPGYSVNVKNGLEHEKDIYIPVFDRKNASRWSGNLKKFSIVNVDGKRLIRGKNNKNATDELGNFTSQALDFWSNSPSSDPDGRRVEKGGLASLIDDPDSRKIYTNLTGNSNVNLSNAANHLALSNISNLTNTELGLAAGSTQDYREKLVNFMRGWDKGDATSSDKKPRYYMGDMLHSEPLVITYNKAAIDGTGKEQYIFASTNEGYLHAFDTKTGEEKFAFMPKELLAKLPEHLFLNAGTQIDHKYGIDGAITGDFRGGSDGRLDSGDRVIIYFGMRRGGSSVYALDVTDINNPKLLWTKSDADHPSMGQSWSTPYIARVGNSSGTPKEVVIVSGGYDEDDDRDKTDGSQEVDDATAAVTADVGNDIFIFDALTGDKIWSLTSSMRSQITNSIPGGVKPIDVNNNGLIDRMYFADTGGHVWRLDISERIGDTSVSAPALTKIASLGGTGASSRKFYNEPDVAKMKLNGKAVFTVSVGSGFRAHPLDKTIDDKFFVLIDDKPYSSIDTPNPITTASLAQITMGQDVGDTIKSPGIRGWMINLPTDGEKVLGNAMAIDGKIIFTSLVPEVLSQGQGIDQCAAPITFSRLYAIDILTGGAGFDLDNDGTITDNDRHSPPISVEILGKIQSVFETPTINNEVDENGNPTGKTSCTHPVDLRAGKKLSQVTGYDACRLESVYWGDPISEQ